MIRCKKKRYKFVLDNQQIGMKRESMKRGSQTAGILTELGKESPGRKIYNKLAMSIIDDNVIL